MAQTPNSYETIQTVDRAFAVLETLSLKGELSLNSLSRVLNINKPSLSRLLYTLVENGYVRKDSAASTFALTMKAYEVGISAIQNLDTISLVNTVLVDLNKRTDRIAQFSVEDENQLLCLESIGQNRNAYSLYTSVGRRSPLYCTSAGKALLAVYSNDEIISKWRRFDVKPMTENTKTDVQDLLKEIAEIRQKHYAVDREENEYHISCIGSVVMGQGNHPIGAISLSGKPFSRENEDELASILIPSVMKLSGLLGYVGN